MFPYLIVSHDYTRTSAGVRALHRLCHHLNERGYPAFVTSPVTCPDLSTPTASPDMVRSLSKNGIVIYPEVEEGNPLEAQRVVRYILNIPGLIRGSGRFADDELLYCYCGLLRRFVPHRDRVLTVPVVETDVFNNTDRVSHREGTVYWVGKGKDVPRVPETKDAVEITFDWPDTRWGLALLLRSSKWFYTYQGYSALTIEARLCGCPTVVIPDGHFDRQDFRWPPGMDGLAWGTDPRELQRAYLTVDRFPLVYQQQVVDQFPHQLDMFIWATQDWRWKKKH